MSKRKPKDTKFARALRKGGLAALDAVTDASKGDHRLAYYMCLAAAAAISAGELGETREDFKGAVDAVWDDVEKALQEQKERAA